MIFHKKRVSYVFLSVVIILGLYFISTPTFFQSLVFGANVLINNGASSTNSRDVTLQYENYNRFSGGSFPYNDLVSYWKMDETSGSTVTDSASGYNGAAVNTSTDSSGKIGYSRAIWTTNSYISVTDKKFFGYPDLWTQMTVAGWIKPASFTAGESIFNRTNGSGNAGMSLYTDDVNGHLACKVRVKLNSGGDPIWVTAVTESSDVLATNQWNHIACTYNSDDVKIYINGTEKKSTPGGAGNMVSNPVSDPTMYIQMGKNVSTGGSINASLDEFGYWKRPLSGTEISTLYNSGNGLALPSPSTINFRVMNETTGFMSYAPSYSFDQNTKETTMRMTQGNGTKTVYAQYQEAGTWQTAVSDTITLAAATPAPNTAKTIMPLGDSITQGAESSTGGGYRQYLKGLLDGGGYTEADFIGSLTAGSFSDNQHEGHGGYLIKDVNPSPTSSDLYSNIQTWMSPSPKPDIILLMAGTNDIITPGEGTNVAQKLSDLIDLIYQYAPNTYILVASIPKIYNYQTETASYVSDVYNLVNTKHFQGFNIDFVDVYNDLTYDGTIYDDFAGATPTPDYHPDDSGYDIISRKFYSAIQGLTSVIAP